MQDKGLGGMSKINIFIIFVIGLTILFRSVFYLTVDSYTIYFILNYDETQGGPVSYPPIWIFFRGIVSPLAYMTELTLVSYMIYH